MVVSGGRVVVSFLPFFSHSHTHTNHSPSASSTVRYKCAHSPGCPATRQSGARCAVGVGGKVVGVLSARGARGGGESSCLSAPSPSLPTSLAHARIHTRRASCPIFDCTKARCRRGAHAAPARVRPAGSARRRGACAGGASPSCLSIPTLSAHLEVVVHFAKRGGPRVEGGARVGLGEKGGKTTWVGNGMGGASARCVADAPQSASPPPPHAFNTRGIGV